MLIFRVLILLLAMTVAAAAEYHCGKSQTTVSAVSHRHHSRTALVFFGYGAARRRANRDAWCRRGRLGALPYMPMGC